MSLHNPVQSRLVSLEVMHGPHQGRVIPIAAQFLIGRSDRCQLRPSSPEVSDFHCGLLARNGRVFLRDFNSITGTYLNGRQICGEIELLHGDQLQIGPLVFLVRPLDQPQPEPEEVASTPVPVDTPTPLPELLESHAAPLPAAEPGWQEDATASASTASSEAAVEEFVAPEGPMPPFLVSWTSVPEPMACDPEPTPLEDSPAEPSLDSQEVNLDDPGPENPALHLAAEESSAVEPVAVIGPAAVPGPDESSSPAIQGWGQAARPDPRAQPRKLLKYTLVPASARPGHAQAAGRGPVAGQGGGPRRDDFHRL